MFLKIATLLAILGLLLSLLLTLIQQSLLIGRFYSSSMQYVFRFLYIGEAVSLVVPLIIFFVAFFLSLNSKKVLPTGAN
jgi:hypothetical protein